MLQTKDQPKNTAKRLIQMDEWEREQSQICTASDLQVSRCPGQGETEHMFKELMVNNNQI